MHVKPSLEWVEAEVSEKTEADADAEAVLCRERERERERESKRLELVKSAQRRSAVRCNPTAK